MKTDRQAWQVTPSGETLFRLELERLEPSISELPVSLTDHIASIQITQGSSHAIIIHHVM
jgi:hypothetical protein